MEIAPLCIVQTENHNKTCTLFFISFSKGSKALKTRQYEPSSQPGRAVWSIAMIVLTTYYKKGQGKKTYGMLAKVKIQEFADQIVIEF